ncbi:hypothetical protein EBI_26751 [Enterocytozoon bieneusi H348]|nr:hypothetical protein EBI_26751 [Enterocytozoon bieneusi H348]|eukprot:XP_002651530.1 hypothetical protein EBI_26751 [Enterocytozoon bieneusi H348]
MKKTEGNFYPLWVFFGGKNPKFKIFCPPLFPFLKKK